MKTLSIALLAVAAASANDAVLWKDPGPIASLDLTGGALGSGRAPQPPFTFNEEELGGTSAKVVVTDGRGVKWTVKFGEEVKAENFASRIVWASGYYADPTFYVADGKIESVGALKRAGQFIRDGQFRDARFELRDNNVARYLPDTKWTFDSRELKDTKELGGLKVLMVLLANWDAKPENFSVVETPQGRRYAVTDWGATMGRAADISGRSKWDCQLYAKDSQHLVEGAEGGFVEFNFDGKQASQIKKSVKLEHVAWLMERLGRLTDPQINAALAASGANAEEKACFARAFKSRLGQMMTVAQQTGNEGVRSRTVTKTTTTTTTAPQQ